MAGFTRAKEAWLPFDPRQRVLAVEKQEKLAESMLHTTRKLIALRKAEATLASGGFEVVEAKDDQLVFDRVAGEQRVRCFFNLGASPATHRFAAKPELLWSADAIVSGTQLVMEPRSAAIVRLA